MLTQDATNETTQALIRALGDLTEAVTDLVVQVKANASRPSGGDANPGAPGRDRTNPGTPGKAPRPGNPKKGVGVKQPSKPSGAPANPGPPAKKSASKKAAKKTAV